jgi:hypothetical protein
MDVCRPCAIGYNTSIYAICMRGRTAAIAALDRGAVRGLFQMFDRLI